MSYPLLVPQDEETSARTKINNALLGLAALEPVTDDVVDLKASVLGIRSDVAGVAARTARAAILHQDLSNRVHIGQADVDQRIDEVIQKLAGRLPSGAYSSPRPGESPQDFTGSLASGWPTTLAPIAAETVVTGDDGPVVQRALSGIVAQRSGLTMEPGRVYAARFAVRRRVNPIDPDGDAVELGLAWFDQAWNLLATAPTVVHTYSDSDELTVARGRTTFEVTFGRPGAGGTVNAPAQARIVKAYVRIYGDLHLTDVEIVQVRDVTSSSLWSPSTAAFNDRLAAMESLSAGSRLAAVESALGTPHSATFLTRSAAISATISAPVQRIETFGYASPGDGGGATYVRVSGQPSHPGKLQSADGAWWEMLPMFRVSPKQFGAKGDGVANDTAAVQAAFARLNMPGAYIDLDGLFRVTAGVLTSNVPVTVRGRGSFNSGLIDTGLAADVYVLEFDNDTYHFPVTLQDFSVLTDQNTVSRGIKVKYSAFDAEFNRTPQRLIMENLELRGRPLDLNGRLTKGFKVGITLQNVIRPQTTNVNISGRGDGLERDDNTYMLYGWECLSDYHPTDPYQRAAPTDPVFRDCQVYSAAVGWFFRGHWEGMLWDHCLAVAVNRGWDIEADTPPGVGGTQFPWVAFSNCHANFFDRAFHVVDYFDVKMINPVIFKWSPAPEGYVSTAAYVKRAQSFALIGGTIRNLTQADGTNEVLNGVVVEDSDRPLIVDVSMAGVSTGVIFSGATYGGIYRRGSWFALPTYGPTPIEYQDLTTNGSNRREGASLDIAASSGSLTLGTTPTDLVYLSTDTLWPGDELEIDVLVRVTKDATSAPVNLFVVKSAGSASIFFFNTRTSAEDTFYASAALSCARTFSTRFRVTQAGSLILALQAACVAGNATIAAGGAQMRLVRSS